jgi:hypothetical protein
LSLEEKILDVPYSVYHSSLTELYCGITLKTYAVLGTRATQFFGKMRTFLFQTRIFLFQTRIFLFQTRTFLFQTRIFLFQTAKFKL